MDLSQISLILAVHGAKSHAHSGDAAEYQAQQLREMAVFGEVLTGYLKQSPSLESVVAGASRKIVVIVPFFTSDGYFTREYLPRLLNLSGSVTRHEGGRTICYLEPVGLSPEIPTLIAAQVRDVMNQYALTAENIQLLVIGHGTLKNPESGTRTFEVSRMLKEVIGCDTCHTCFIEMEPHLKDWRSNVTRENILVVPFFASPGLHASVDIPESLGIKGINMDIRVTHHREKGFNLWLLPVFGYEKSLSGVIKCDVEDFMKKNLAF